MKPNYKTGEVVRLSTSLEEGTITNIREDEASVYVTWNHSTGNSGWYKPEDLLMVRGSVSSGNGAALTLADLGNGAIGTNPSSLGRD